MRKASNKRQLPGARGVKRKTSKNLSKRGGRGKPLSSSTFKAYNYKKTFVLRPIKIKDEHNSSTKVLRPVENEAVSAKKACPAIENNRVLQKKECEREHLLPSTGQSCSIFNFADKGNYVESSTPVRKAACIKENKTKEDVQPQLKKQSREKKTMSELIKEFGSQHFARFNKEVVAQLKIIATCILESQEISCGMPLSSHTEVKRVRFCPYDLSALEAPSISIPGSEEPALNILRILCKVSS